MVLHTAPAAVAVRTVCRWLPWLAMLLVLVYADANEVRAGPGLWLLLGLAAARLVAWLWSGAPAAGEHPVLWAASGPVAYLVWIHDRERIPEALRWLSPFVAAFVALKLLGVAYLININLLGNALLLCLAGWLALERPWRHPGLWLTAAALLATTSRGAALGAVVMALGYQGWLAAAIPTAPLAVLALTTVRSPATFGWHLRCWANYLVAWLRSPITGHGAGWTGGYLPVHGHNVLVTALAWEGLPGAAAVVAGAWAVVRARGRWPAWALWGLAGALAHGLVDDFTHAPLSMALLAGLLAADREA